MALSVLIGASALLTATAGPAAAQRMEPPDDDLVSTVVDSLTTVEFYPHQGIVRWPKIVTPATPDGAMICLSAICPAPPGLGGNIVTGSQGGGQIASGWYGGTVSVGPITSIGGTVTVGSPSSVGTGAGTVTVGDVEVVDVVTDAN